MAVLGRVRIAVCALIAVVVLAPAVAHAGSDVAEARQMGVSWLEQHHADVRGGRLAVRDVAAAAGVLAVEGSPAASGAVEWLASQVSSNNDFAARSIHARALAGSSDASAVAALLSSQNIDGGLGLSRDGGSDVLDTALALDAFVASSADATACEKAVSYLVSVRNPDGGWGVAPGEPSTVMMTAHSLSALASWRPGADLVPPGTDTAISAGSAWLAAQQRPDSSFGDTLWEDALAYDALASCEPTIADTASISRLTASISAQDGVAGDVYTTALVVDALRRADVNLSAEELHADPSSPRLGTTVRLIAVVRNTGAMPTPPSSVRFVSGDSTDTCVTLGDADAPALAPGAEAEVGFNLSTADYALATVLTAIADPDGAIRETDEADNAVRTTLVLRDAFGSPSPLLPSAGSWCATSSVAVVWSGPAGAGVDSVAYLLEYDRSPAFDSAGLSRVATSAPGVAGATVTLRGLADGMWYWRVRAHDDGEAGPFTATRAFVVDTAKPALKGVSLSAACFSPNDDGVLDTLKATGSVTETATLIAQVRAGATVIRTQEVLTPAGDFEWAWDGASDSGQIPADGTHTVHLSALDDAGNASPSSVCTVVIDTVAPRVSDMVASVATISPNGDGYLESVGFSWGRSEVAKATLRVLDGTGSVVRTVATTDLSYSWNGTDVYNKKVADGRCALAVTLADAAGNASSEASVQVVVDTTCAAGKLRLDPAVARPSALVTLTLPVGDDSVATVTVAGSTYGLGDPDGDGDHTAMISAPAIEGNYPVTLNVRDGVRNKRDTVPTALVVRSNTVRGREWVQDTRTDFNGLRIGDRDWNPSVNDSTSIDSIPGSVILAAKGWSTRNPMPDARVAAATCLGPDGRIYVFGGFFQNTWGGSNQHRLTNDTLAYDPHTDQWERLAPIPAPRGEARAILAPDGRIYVIGGDVLKLVSGAISGESTGIVDAYDPATDTWIQDVDHGGTLATMPTGRTMFGAVLGGDGRIYCVGGYVRSGAQPGSTDAVEVYDPVGNSWAALPPMPKKECCFSCATGPDHELYVMEGHQFLYDPAGGWVETHLNEVWRLETDTGEWEALPPSPEARTNGAGAIGADHRVYSFGGLTTSNGNSQGTHGHDLGSGEWLTRNPLPQGFVRTQGASDLGGAIYAMGGGVAASYGYFSTFGDVQRFETDYASPGTYTSPVRELGDRSTFGEIRWDSVVPTGTSVEFQTRSSIDNVTWSGWSEPYLVSGSSISSPVGRFVQYRAVLRTSDPVATARLDKVTIVYNACPTAPTHLSDMLFSTRTPEVIWTQSGDAEGDAVSYDLQIDTGDGFDSAQMREYEGIVTESYWVRATVAAADALDEANEWRYRVRATDGITPSGWSQAARLSIDGRPPVASVAVTPTAFGLGELGRKVRFTYSVDETGSADLYVVRSGTNMRTWAINGTTPGTSTFEWDGRLSNGSLAPTGEYEVRFDARDNMQNRAMPVSAAFSLNSAPLVTGSVWASSDPLDPQAPTVLRVPTTGSSLDVVASSADGDLHLLDADRDGVFSGSLPAGWSSSSTTLTLKDGVTGASDRLRGLTIESPGQFSGSLWSQSTSAAFAGGTPFSSLIRPTGEISLPTASWTSLTTTLSTGRYCMVGDVIGSRVWAIGGSDGGFTNTVDVLDLATGQRTAGPPLPTPRFYAAGAAVGDQIYVAGGSPWGTSSYRNFEVLDTSTGTWQVLPPLGHNRYAATAAGWGGRLYLVGGMNTAAESTASLESYDPATGVWQTLAPMPYSVYHAAMCLHKDKLYVFGGTMPGGGSISAVQVYDLRANTWSLASPLDAPWSGHSAVSNGDRIYLFGTSYGGYAWKPASFSYDPDADEYRVNENPITPAQYALAVSYEGAVYRLGGYTYSYYGSYKNSIEKYDPRVDGTYASRTFDASETAQWGRIGLTTVRPAHTSVSVMTRSSANGADWSAWEGSAAGGSIASPPGRYIQYRCALATSDSPRVPVVGDVTISYTLESAERLTAPSILRPADGSGVSRRDPELAWADAEGPTPRTYEVQLATDPSFEGEGLRTFEHIAETADESRLLVPSTGPLAQGPWFWRVRAVTDSAEGPWSAVASFTVATRPDLTIAAIELPVEAEDGDLATVRASVRNLGAAASDVRVRVYDGDPLSGGRPIGRDRIVPSLSFGDSAEVSTVFDTTGRAGETCRVVAVVDPGAAIAEANESDNARDGEFAVVPHGVAAGVSCDRATYAADDTMSISAVVSNTGASAHDLVAIVEIIDSDGAVVEQVTSEVLGAIAPGAQRSLSGTWTTGSTYAGAYRARIRVLRDGRELASAAEGFAIGGTGGVDAKVSCDRLAYASGQSVGIRSRVINASANSALSSATVRTTVTGPEGTTLLDETADLPQMHPGELRDVGSAWSPGTAPAGVYEVTELVLRADDSIAATAATTFEVVPTSECGVGLAGDLAVEPATARQGESVEFAYTLANHGNSDVSGLPLVLSVVDPVTTSTVASVAVSADVAMAAEVTGELTLQTADWPIVTSESGRDFIGVLTAEFGGRALTLGHANVRVLPVSTEVALELGGTEYDMHQSVAITATVSNETSGYVLADAGVRWSVTDPDGAVVDAGAVDLPPLEASNSASYAWTFETAARPPGVYSVRAESVRGVMVLGSSEATFRVLPTAVTGTGLAGSLATTSQVRAGEQLHVGWAVINGGNADVIGLPSRVELVDALSGDLLGSEAFELAVDRAGTAVGEVVFETDVLDDVPAGRELELCLVVSPSSGERRLATASTRLVRGVDIDGAVRLAAPPRVLVRAEASADADLAWRALGSTDAYMRVVDDDGDFVCALRSGVYDTIVILGKHHPLPAWLDEELVEHVRAGKTLIGTGDANSDDLKNRGVFGVKFSGRLSPQQRTIALPETSCTAAATLVVGGSMQRVSPETAVVLAWWSGVPALTCNSPGRGTALLFTFDLSTAQDPMAAADALRNAVLKTAPESGDAHALDVVPFEVDVSNRGAPTRVRVGVRAAPGSVVEAPEAAMVTAGGAQWECDLAAGETRTLRLLVRRADTAAAVRVTAEWSHLVGAEWVAVGSASGESPPGTTRAQLLDRAIVRTRALPVTGKSEARVVSWVVASLEALRAEGSDPFAAISSLVRAAQDLASLSTDTNAARLAIDDLIVYYGCRWYL